MSDVRAFLGSQGLGALSGWLDELPRRPERAVLIPTAGNRIAATPWVDVAIGVLTGCGLELETLDLEGASPTVVEAMLDRVGLVFVTGGDPIFLLEHAHRSGFVPAVRNAVSAGRLAYAGVSAGAILTAPDLELYRTPDDPGRVNGTDGLGLVRFFPLVHANRGRQERYARLIAAHPDIPFVAYSDDEAVIVTGSTWHCRPSAITAPLSGPEPRA
ncbi:Type 1 glutamine amidotransferase-like domain-containing protein [Actinocatenispora sera]|uniref:Type 1 glutamine amidotransferase-like domain-containing protein n=1 Tax=Actinocatenispora sera TaxID=390989 RepID=UPI0014700D24|nr:Type 1 glutamine amidotransferase-like domain-containing protein [Actinocatenispora sera]